MCFYRNFVKKHLYSMRYIYIYIDLYYQILISNYSSCIITKFPLSEKVFWSIKKNIFTFWNSNNFPSLEIGCFWTQTSISIKIFMHLLCALAKVAVGTFVQLIFMTSVKSWRLLWWDICVSETRNDHQQSNLVTKLVEG